MCDNMEMLIPNIQTAVELVNNATGSMRREKSKVPVMPLTCVLYRMTLLLTTVLRFRIGVASTSAFLILSLRSSVTCRAGASRHNFGQFHDFEPHC